MDGGHGFPENVDLANNNARQSSHVNNGRRVWIPRGRGHPNQNPNPVPDSANDTHRRDAGRENLISNLNLITNSNSNDNSDANANQNSNHNYRPNPNPNSDTDSTSNQNFNRSKHRHWNSNRNSVNSGADFRNGFQGPLRYRQVGLSLSGVDGARQATQLSGSQQNVSMHSASTHGDELQLDDNSLTGGGASSHRGNQRQRPAKGRGRNFFDRNNNYRRIEVSNDQQNGASQDIVGVINFESNANDCNEIDNEAPNHFPSSSNEDLIGQKNHQESMWQRSQEIKHHAVGTFHRNNEHIERDTGASNTQQNFTNEDLISPSIDRNPPHSRPQQIRQMEDLSVGSIQRNGDYHNDRDNLASNSGHNSTSQDLILPSNDRKHPPQFMQQQRSDLKDLGYVNRSSSQDWRYHAPSSEIHVWPLSKQESEEDMLFARSNLPQLMQEIEQKLLKGKVECMICYEMVGRSAAIWSCNSCYALFHLHCIRKWARTPTSVDLSAGQGQSSNWRCPGCQSVQYSSPEDLRYYCFCGKMQDPSKDFYLTPHSCGESCGKPLDKGKKISCCPHTCTLQCHPGPCPPCTAMAPPQPCPCGKKTITRRCSDQKSAESCGQVCEKLLSCGRHFCDKICHEGPCDTCKILINASCFCGKKEKMILCGNMEVQGKVEWKNGVYACENLCTKKLSCQNHNCSLGCHPGECGECDLLPGKVKTCPCGKTQLLNQRKSCMDPISTCSEVCEKVLPCGKHTCINTCHQGICPPCLVPVDQNCRCGFSFRKVSCWKTTSSTVDNEDFVCEKVCGQKKNCGRHRCSDKCCPLSHRGRSDVQSSDWDPHLCHVPCGKKMRCGQHFCQELCHSGYCPPCLETIFTDLSCACGKTSIPPPVPCGTPIPSCTYPCSIPQPCGHLATHNCHSGECPPCTVTVAKECVGNHVTLRNVPCGSREIRCNKLCGKTRQCGMHACARTCHLPPCDIVSIESSSKARISCGQTCGALRRDCRHTCSASCHPSSPCPDTRCAFPVTITCSCGRLIAQVPCDAGGNSIRADPVFEASILHKLPSPLQPLESHLTRVPLGQRKLTCDDECAKLERKKTLATAFDISTTVDLPGLNGAMSEMLADLIRREPQWVSAVEERFKYLVLGRTKTNTHIVRVHVFAAVPKEKRDMVRHLAERWNLSVYSAGWEPRRFLIVQATQKSRAPARNLLLKSPLQTTGQVQPPAFNSLVDMDPRLVLALFDLPREADISSLILRFGGECELAWLNDKNALAIFTDPARAATAMRRVSHASAYRGAVLVPLNGGLPSCSAWGAKEGGGVEKDNAWKKKVQESAWMQDSWGEDWSSTEVSNSVWQLNNNPIITTKNPWGALEKESEGGTNSSRNHAHMTSKPPLIGASSEVSSFQKNQNEDSVDEVDDWEKAFE